MYRLPRRHVLGGFSISLHPLRHRQVRSRHSFNRLHQLRGGHVLGIDWSLNLPFMLGWVVFVIRFIEQLHAVRSRQVLYGIRGNVGLYMLPELPRLCKLAGKQRLGGRLHVQRRLVGPQRWHVCDVRGGQVH